MPNEKGTTLYKIQKKFQNIFGFTLPLFHGRGILNCGFIQPSRHILPKLTMLQITGACFRTADRSSQSVSLSRSHVNNEQRILISPNSWPSRSCSKDGQSNRRTDQRGARGVYRGTYAVSGVHTASLPKPLIIVSIRRIWNKYKDEFARTRRRELNIID
jgi:Diacylglycerol acyltransferase